MKLNTVGAQLAEISAVSCITDVAALACWAICWKSCQGNNLAAFLNLKDPLLDNAVIGYANQDAFGAANATGVLTSISVAQTSRARRCSVIPRLMTAC